MRLQGFHITRLIAVSQKYLALLWSFENLFVSPVQPQQDYDRPICHPLRERVNLTSSSTYRIPPVAASLISNLLIPNTLTSKSPNSSLWRDGCSSLCYQGE